MRMAHSRPGRAALGAAAAAGVKHMAHRFIVGETPRDAEGIMKSLWKDGVGTSVDLLGEATVTRAEADRYAARCREALDGLAEVYRGLPARPILERDSAGPIPRANLSVKVTALTPLLRPDAPELGKRDAAGRLRELLRHAKELGAHLHIDMESFDSREAVTELVLELLAEDEFRDGPSAGVVLQAYLRDSPELCARIVDWAHGSDRAPAAARAPRQGRLLGPRGRRGQAARLDAAGLRGQGRVRPQLRGADAHAAGRAGPRGPRRRSRRTTCARSPTPSPRTARSARPTATSSSRSCAASATISSTRSPPAGCACAPTARSATSSPAWPTSCAACWRTRPTSASWPSRPAGAPSRSCWPRRERVRQRADPRAAPRAAREALLEGMRAFTEQAIFRVPVWIGDDERHGEELVSTDPGDPDRVVATAASASADEAAEAVAAAPRAASPAGARRPPSSAPRSWSARPRGCASAAASSPRWRSASAPSRGARPTPTSARRSTSSSTTRAAPSPWAAASRSSRCPASATSCATRRAASSPSIAPWNFPIAIPCGMIAAGARHRQHRRAQAGRAVARLRPRRGPRAARERRARRRAGAAARRGRGGRRARRPPRRPHDRLHRVRARRPVDPARPRRSPGAGTSSASSPRWAARTA